MSNNGGEKVAFSLGTKKKRKVGAPSSVVASEFGSSNDADKKKSKPERTLVIPLPESSAKEGPLLARAKEIAPVKKEEASKEENEANADGKAAQALVEAAAQHFAQKNAGGVDGGTDFSAKGKMVISSRTNTFENAQEKETDQFRKDLEARPEEVPVDSDVYENVRVVDFGAAMLRGMGWTGDDGGDTKKGDMDMPRPHRLGLGATPKMPSVIKNKMRRPDQVKRDQQQEQLQREYEARRQEQIKMDKQLTLQIGSIVNCNGKRAKMIQLQGVPGLNQVKVQYENENEAVSVKKSSVSLIDREELNERPFREVPLKKPLEHSSRGERERNGGEMWSRDKESRGDSDDRYSRDKDRRSSREDRTCRDSDRRYDRSDDKDRRDDRRSRRRSRSKERESSTRDRKRRREDRNETESKNSRSPQEERHWLIPDIRVRVVSKKFGSRQYKQKGVVLDVAPGGSAATLQMEGGQVLGNVSERHLETALPKAGGNAIVLVGKHRFAKGKLLERDSSKGIIQVFEDMSILTLSLDDIAQWCGPLDDDLG